MSEFATINPPEDGMGINFSTLPTTPTKSLYRDAVLDTPSTKNSSLASPTSSLNSTMSCGTKRSIDLTSVMDSEKKRPSLEDSVMADLNLSKSSRNENGSTDHNGCLSDKYVGNINELNPPSTLYDWKNKDFIKKGPGTLTSKRGLIVPWPSKIRLI